ncbi:MAG: SRPBCC family protein [Planctomycetota bacterium]
MLGLPTDTDLGFTICRRIDASPETVFRIFTELEKASERIPGIEKVELLTAGPVGLGTRFIETRRVRGRQVRAEMEITRFEEGEGYVVRCSSRGCDFTSAFCMFPDGDATKVEVALDCEPKTWLARLRVRFLLRPMRREFDRDFTSLQAVAETSD